MSDDTDPFADLARVVREYVEAHPESEDEPFVLPDLTEAVRAERRPKRSEIAAARLKIALAESRRPRTEVEPWVRALAAIPLTDGGSE